MFNLNRIKHSGKTEGEVTLPDGEIIKTLELPWLDNKVGMSSIPDGIYKFMVDNTGKHQWFKLLNVPGRTFIEWHEGYKTSHSEGCILSSKEDLIKLSKWCNEPDKVYVLNIRTI